MAISRLGFTGSMVAYGAFTDKSTGAAATPATGMRYRYGYRLNWSAMLACLLVRW